MTKKSLTFAPFVLLVTLASLPGTVSGQVRSVTAANRQTASNPAKPNASEQNPADRMTGTRARVSRQNAQPTRPTGNSNERTLQAHAKSGSRLSPNTGLVRTTTSTTMENAPSNITGNRARTVSNPPATPVVTKPAALLSNTNANPSTSTNAVPSQTYRIGVRDVLDIQLPGQTGKQSTLFTVFDGGLLEYPLAGGPIPVAGLTTSEVAALLRERIKILDSPAVKVNVRDYASHPVTVTGFVAAPGVKNIRREAVPLYTMLAEALMLPEAASATISRQGRPPIVVDLKDPNLTATLVLPGDTIKVSGMPAGPTEFFFVGGAIGSPGQKPFHAGVTLTQAILASGGTTKNAGSKVRVSRQGADGRLITEEYNLRKIEAGKNPDPVLQKGDRIQVTEDR